MRLHDDQESEVQDIVKQAMSTWFDTASGGIDCLYDDLDKIDCDWDIISKMDDEEFEQYIADNIK